MPATIHPGGVRLRAYSIPRYKRRFRPLSFSRREGAEFVTEPDMILPWHRSDGWARSLALAVCSAALCIPALPRAAYAQAEPPVELAANADLPDAPQPASSLDFAPGRAQPNLASSLLQPPAQTPPPAGPSLGDLGLTPEDTEGSAARQALFDKRTRMLKMHQRLGLITVIPVAAACITAAGAPPKHGDFSNTADRDLHVALGAASVAMYAWTASYAIRAPRVSNEHARGGVKWHKYLIYAHAPGMILTPILGAIAFNQINSGQKVHGIASAHGPVAIITAGSYGAAIIAVSWPIHLKF